MTPEEKWITIPCIRITQPIGEFYIAGIGSKDLADMSYADRRRILEGEREIEVVSGIQRQISPKRVAELKQYVSTIDACFPTGVILAIDGINAIFDKDSNTMRIRVAQDVAKIIDGQHRIEGLTGYQGPPFEINVTIFVDMEMEDQAIVFSTINLKQVPVAGSLVYDLYDYATTRSPQKTCHYIARLLNARSDSPFHQRIMILGTATGKPNESLTQAAFIDPLLRLLSANAAQAMADRDALKRGKPLPLVDVSLMRQKKLIFRNMFIREEDAKVAKVLWNYFTAVSQRWPLAWNQKHRGLILNRTTGYRALMQFLPIVILSLDLTDEVPDVPTFSAIFQRVGLTDEELNTTEFPPGSSGQSRLRKALEYQTHFNDETIWPSGRGQRLLDFKTTIPTMNKPDKPVTTH
jgi:DGQHR domain-containing protein